MSGTERQRRHDNPRIHGVLGGVLGAGGVAMILVVTAIASGAVAPAAAFPGATWSPSATRTIGGCGSAAMTIPGWSAATGAGHWKGSAYAHTCSAVYGGPAALSSGAAYAGISINAPVTLTTGAGGVNVSWNLDLGAWTSATYSGTPTCPTTTVTVDTDYGYTWFNYTDTYSDCYALAEMYIYAITELYDSTNGSFYVGNNGSYWQLSATSGADVYSYNFSGTYSNSSYWIYNYTYTYSYSSASGHHDSVSGVYAPQTFINGTFVASHNYIVETTISESVYAYVYGFAGAGAQAHFNAQTRGHHENLNPIVTW